MATERNQYGYLLEDMKKVHTERKYPGLASTYLTAKLKMRRAVVISSIDRQSRKGVF